VKKTLQDQIKDLENTRAAKAGQLEGITQKGMDEGRGFDETEGEEFDTLSEEIEQIDKDLVRLRKMEKLQVGKAARVTVDGTDEKSASRQRGDERTPHVIMLDKKRDKGLDYARFVGCLVAGRGSIGDALTFAKGRFKDDSMLHKTLELRGRMNGEQIIKAAVDVGTTTDTDFANPLIYYTNMANDFIDFLRPQTIIGRIPGLRQVPFDIRMARMTSGATAQWVGEGAPKPLSRQAFDAVTLGHTKLAVITAITEELARFSSPSAEAIIRNDLAKAVVQVMDADFVDPDNAGSANVKPASIINGVTPVVANGGNTEANIRSDVGAIFNEWVTNNLDPSTGVWIMPASVAMRLSLLTNALGQRPEGMNNISAQGGSFFGLPVVTSQSLGLTNGSANGKVVILANASEILLADDGQVSIDVSREASLQMEDAPTNPVVAATVLISLWQQNLIGIKAERFINWTKARATSVSWINSVNWGE
jgi:HK97 family phage major capsid protein